MIKPTLLVLAAGMGSRYGSLKQMDGEFEAVAQSLEQLDRWRYAPGAKAGLPHRRWWAQLSAAVAQLRHAAPG